VLIRGLIRALIRGSQDPHLALTPDRDKRGALRALIKGT